MRRAPQLTLIFAALILAGCAPRDLAPREVELAAWWIEDVAHGRERSADELVAPGASQGLLRVARWVRGPDERHESPPSLLARRRERHATLTALIADGVIASDRASGGLATTPAAAKSGQRAIAEGLVAEENADRDAVDIVVLSFAHARDAAARRYRAAVRQARLAWDGDTSD